jgi:hypothetical protein
MRLAGATDQQAHEAAVVLPLSWNEGSIAAVNAIAQCNGDPVFCNAARVEI